MISGWFGCIPRTELLEIDSVSLDAQSGSDELLAGVGRSLRALRKAANLTLEELATRCDLSQPFLSQIETGRARPSLNALHRVAQALGTTAYELMGPESEEQSVVRHGEGARYVVADGATVRFLTNRHDRRLGMSEIVAAPNTVMDHKTAHAGQEAVHLVEGSLIIELDSGDRFELKTGDTASYAATIPHTWRSGPQGARFLITCAPASF